MREERLPQYIVPDLTGFKVRGARACSPEGRGAAGRGSW